MKDFSNYHNVNMVDKIKRDGLLLLQNSLNGAEGYDVTINGKQTKVLIYQKYDSSSEIKKVIGYIEDIKRGNIVEIEDKKWLITTYPEDNKIYRKAEMELCNFNFPIATGTTQVLIGKDSLGRPVYETQTTYTYYPCVIKSTLSAVTENNSINLPNDYLLATLPYNDNTKLIKLNTEINYYDNTYKVTNFDFSGVINGENEGTFLIMLNHVTTS